MCCHSYQRWTHIRTHTRTCVHFHWCTQEHTYMHSQQCTRKLVPYGKSKVFHLPKTVVPQVTFLGRTYDDHYHTSYPFNRRKPQLHCTIIKQVIEFWTSQIKKRCSQEHQHPVHNAFPHCQHCAALASRTLSHTLLTRTVVAQ